jgi:glycosyltransferase involved in cell wall biosynthesis
MRNKITAVVVVKNGAMVIEECLKSLKWCDEILVIDDQSKDNTLEICKNLRTKVVTRAMEGNFAEQRNYAYGLAKNKWLFYVDADEIVPEKLKLEIVRYFNRPISKKISAFEMKRDDYFLGKLLKHGASGSHYFCRIIRKDRTIWINPIYEKPEVNGKRIFLKERLVHNRPETIKNFVNKANFYSSLEAKFLDKEGAKLKGYMLITKPLELFFRFYILKLGFLDGMPGLMFVMMASVLPKFLTYSKLWSLRNL